MDKEQKFVFTRFLVISISFLVPSLGLKCRSTETTIQDQQDMEYAVRECVRQMTKNNSSSIETRKEEGGGGGDPYVNLKNWDKNNSQKDRDRNPSKRDFRDRETKGSYREDPFRGQRDPDTGRRGPSWDFMAFSSSNGRPNRQGFQPQPDHNNPRDEDFNQGDKVTDFNNGPPMPDNARRRQRGKERPHSVGQQSQHDRDVGQNYNGHKQLFQSNMNNNNYNNNNNNNNNNGFQQEQWGDSTLAGFDPLDERGRLSKQAVTAKLTRRLRDRELRDFLQETVEECFDRLQEDWKPSRFGGRDDEDVCRQSRNLAICLEERGKQVCEDWDDPMHSGEKENKQKNNIEGMMNADGKNGPNNNNNSKRGG